MEHLSFDIFLNSQSGIIFESDQEGKGSNHGQVQINFNTYLIKIDISNLQTFLTAVFTTQTE